VSLPETVSGILKPVSEQLEPKRFRGFPFVTFQYQNPKLFREKRFLIKNSFKLTSFIDPFQDGTHCLPRRGGQIFSHLKVPRRKGGSD